MLGETVTEAFWRFEVLTCLDIKEVFANKSGCTNYCWVINKYQDVEESESYCGFLVWFLTHSCYISELSFNSDWQCESQVLQIAEQVKMSNKR